MSKWINHCEKREYDNCFGECCNRDKRLWTCEKEIVFWSKIIVFNSSSNNEPDAALIKEYKSNNIELLEPVQLPSISDNKYTLKNIFTLSIFKETFFYPLLKHQEKIEASIKKWNPDAIIVIWDEMITPVVANLENIPIKYLYYGNLDYKVFNARSHMRFFYEKGFFIKKILHMINMKFIKIH